MYAINNSKFYRIQKLHPNKTCFLQNQASWQTEFVVFLKSNKPVGKAKIKQIYHQLQPSYICFSLYPALFVSCLHECVLYLSVTVTFDVLNICDLPYKMSVKLPVCLQYITNLTSHRMIKLPHCKYQRYILTRCSVNLLVVFNTMVLKRVFFVIINTCVALIWALMC